MRIAYASIFDPTDPLVWSGTEFRILQGLIDCGHEVTIFGNLYHGRSVKRYCRKTIARLLGKQHLHFWDNETSRDFSSDLSRKMKSNGVFDCVVSASPVPVAFLRENYKVFVWTDATYCSLSQYHREFSPQLLSSSSVKHANNIDSANVFRGTNFILSSQWAADSLIDKYPKAKVSVIPFGANADDIDCLVRTHDGAIRFAFLAVRWDEKGGDKAFAIFKSVQSKFPDAEFHVIGCNPPEDVESHKGVHLHGFIDKTTASGRLVFRNVMSRCDYIVVPTYAEAYGLFAAEGAMFGSIVLTHNVGGLSTIIEHGKSGFLFRFDQTIQHWVDTVEALENDDQYKKLIQSNARSRYELLLNWKSATVSFDSLLRCESV